MKKLQLGKDALILAILTLITVLSWIAFDVYRALTKTEVPEVLQRQIAPLNPKVKQEIIEKLKTRETISEEELKTVVVPQITPAPEATPPAETTPTPGATPSGEVSE